MRIVPLGDKVVVKRLDMDEQTAGGIFIPDTARVKPQQGRVLSVGEGRLLADGSRSTPQISEGDRVLFLKYSGTDVPVDADELLILSEDDILAILD